MHQYLSTFTNIVAHITVQLGERSMSILGKQQLVQTMTSADTTTAAAMCRSMLAIHMVLLGKPRPGRATQLTAVVSNSMLTTFATNMIVPVDQAVVSLASRLLFTIVQL